ncbi:MAG: hypothetical protein ABJA37_07950 [Ferruginibacter sp.]
MRKYIFLLFTLGIFLNSCKKKDSEILNPQAELLNELGFNIKNVRFEKSNSNLVNTALKFENKEVAKLYFKTLFDHNKTPFQGNVGLKWTLRKDFDPIEYIKNKLNQKNNFGESSSQSCLYPWMDGCDPNQVVEDGPPGVASFNQWIGWTGYNVNFTYNYSGGTFVVTEPNSGLIGMHLGVSWEQGATSFTNYPNSALIYFTIVGFQNYNIIVEGLGTVFTQTVTITGSYNTNTGAYTISSTP